MSAKIDISPEQLGIVQGILKDHLPKGTLAWAFGSRVTWTAKPFSDLDIALEWAEPLPSDVLIDLEEAFQASDLPWKVDVIDLNAVSPEFRAIVERHRAPADWRPSTWGEEISLNYGKAIRGYQEAKGQYRVFGTNGPVGRTDEALAKGPGIILGRKGAYRGVHFSDDPFWVIDTAYFVRPLHDELDMRWLYYAMQYHKLGEIDDGSPIPSTTRAAVYVRDVDIPNVHEQRAIANCLVVYDRKIELNRRMNDTLEAMARAVFRDWFVDFGPTRRKAAGTTDHAAILGGLLPDPTQAKPLAALFPDSFGANGLPEGWEERTCADFMDILDSKRVPLSAREREKKAGDIPYYGATSVMGYVDEALFDEVLLLVGEDGSVVRPDGTPFTQYIWGKSWVNNHAHVLKGAGISTEQLKVFFDQVQIQPYVTGAVQAKLNQKNMKTIPLIFGGTKLHESYDSFVRPIFDLIRNNTEENQTLAATRDLLLPRLMSGEIRLTGAEGVV